MRRAVFVRLFACAAALGCAASAPAQSFEPVRDVAVQLSFEERDDLADWPAQDRPNSARPGSVRFASHQPSEVDARFQSNSSTGRSDSSSDEAARAITPRSEAAAATRTRGGSAWTTVLALAFVVGLILVVARWWRRHGPPPPRTLPDEAFEVLGRTRLDPRRSVELFRIGRKILVVGSAGDGLRTLAEIDDPAEVDRLAGLCRRSESNDLFAGRLRLLLGGGRSVEETEPEDHEAAIAEFAQHATPISARDFERAEAAHG